MIRAKLEEEMDLHIEKACAGLRKIAKFNGQKPDLLLYIGHYDANIEMPESISGIPVVESPAFFGGVDFGLACKLLYIPCYKKLKANHYFDAYKDAYEDYI